MSSPTSRVPSPQSYVTNPTFLPLRLLVLVFLLAGPRPGFAQAPPTAAPPPPPPPRPGRLGRVCVCRHERQLVDADHRSGRRADLRPAPWETRMKVACTLRNKADEELELADRSASSSGRNGDTAPAIRVRPVRLSARSIRRILDRNTAIEELYAYTLVDQAPPSSSWTAASVRQRQRVLGDGSQRPHSAGGVHTLTLSKNSPGERERGTSTSRCRTATTGDTTTSCRSPPR